MCGAFLWKSVLDPSQLGAECLPRYEDHSEVVPIVYTPDVLIMHSLLRHMVVSPVEPSPRTVPSGTLDDLDDGMEETQMKGQVNYTT